MDNNHVSFDQIAELIVKSEKAFIEAKTKFERVCEYNEFVDYLDLLNYRFLSEEKRQLPNEEKSLWIETVVQHLEAYRFRFKSIEIILDTFIESLRETAKKNSTDIGKYKQKHKMKASKAKRRSIKA